MFLATYRAYATTQEVLDQLVTSYGCVLSSWDEIGGDQEQRGTVISSILGTWLDHYPEDFFQPPEFPCLKTLLAYVGLLVPGSDLEQRAWLLLSRLRHLEPAEPEAGGEEDWG
ncbi:ral guanine nucleotide dissociation stimulator-like [Ursus arctos]|uniref:ral guanine nucleotide dissociation stimulator-like n=1 Tax=Ursus arctos TaxID=9644 RepID=UPI00254770CA|nr:ral guanine nucleotide dissociation stimulator-like [Ursus arctos]XP_057162432.1 ral guanine nucleotide dissociation stimulator-like [Ursus arctos]XP_057162433.1 ral guanine nucleotide dissociation stimulator-like [Ursus arctos]XP_057162434.1 ral guanine nucleotide dissociation stimulator-like [Ursus arctos]